MKIKRFEIWLADLNPQFGTETGKARPVVIVQTELLNEFHRSTIICPITTNVKADTTILRVHISKGTAKLREHCDVMIDQIRAIDNKRLLKRIGDLPEEKINLMKTNMGIVLDL